MASEVDRLPETPVVLWSEWRTPWWSWAWAFLLRGWHAASDRRGIVEISVNGIMVTELPASGSGARFVSWGDVVGIDPVGSATTVAVINMQPLARPDVVLGARHIPWGRRGPEVSARRAAVLARAWELAQVSLEGP